MNARRFAAEFPMSGMVYAALAFSTIAKGRIATLDTSEEEAAPGVVLVMTHRNAPSVKSPPALTTQELAASGDDLPVMQDDRSGVERDGPRMAVGWVEVVEPLMVGYVPIRWAGSSGRGHSTGG